MTQRGSILVISGTGGAGKGTIVERLRAEHRELWWSVSWATRSPREGERDGEHYYFRTADEFVALRGAGGFLEWAEVYGVLKGTPRAPLDTALAEGRACLLEMDIQGALSVAASYPDAAVVFVVTASVDVQAERLRARSTDTDDEIQRRLDQAVVEEATARTAGFSIVVNDDIDRAMAQVSAILNRSRAAIAHENP